MTASTRNWVAFLRAIGPATHKLMTMSQLRDACAAAGLENPRTILATGNLLIHSDKTAADLKTLLRGILAQHGLDNDVFLRLPADLRRVLAANPLPEASNLRPNHMLVLFLDSPPGDAQLEKLAGYDGPEAIHCIGAELYIDYVYGVAGSKLTPARLEKMLGEVGTARNWNTIRKIVEVLDA